MKNDYRVEGEETIIFVKRRNGEVIEVLIDTEDLEKLHNLDRSICVNKYKGGKYYAFFRGFGYKDYTFTFLHRFLMNTPDDLVVDHINGKSLDNRKSNMRNTTQQSNTQNRGAQSNNKTTGVRGVVKKKNGRYRAMAKVEGKQTYLGTYETLEEANAVVTAVREKHMNIPSGGVT